MMAAARRLAVYGNQQIRLFKFGCIFQIERLQIFDETLQIAFLNRVSAAVNGAGRFALLSQPDGEGVTAGDRVGVRVVVALDHNILVRQKVLEFHFWVSSFGVMV